MCGEGGTNIFFSGPKFPLTQGELKVTDLR